MQAALIAGAGTGLVGGALSAATPKRRNETRGGRRRRILRDAALSGVTGGGIAAGAMYGMDQLSNVLPAGTENPMKPALHGLVRGGTGVGVGVLTKGYANKGREDAAAMYIKKLMKDDKSEVAKSMLEDGLDKGQSARKALGRFFYDPRYASDVNELARERKLHGAHKYRSGAEMMAKEVDSMNLPRNAADRMLRLHNMKNLRLNKSSLGTVRRGVKGWAKRHPAALAGAAAAAGIDPIMRHLGGGVVDALPPFLTYDKPQVPNVD